jgi:DNA-binding NarL/FixJ family response regulator
LRFWCGLSVEEAAAEMGCSVGTVKSQTARAMVSVRSTWIRLHDRLLTACTTRRRVAATCAHSIMKIGLFLREA